MNLLDTALALHAAGMSVVPVSADGQKRPAGRWAEYQTIRANRDQLQQWFEAGNAGIGVVTGTVSGNLEMLEIEGRGKERIAGLADIAKNSSLGPLWAKLIGWLEESPSGGYHWFYRVKWPEGTKTPGNTKIASRPSTATELAANPRQKQQVLAETRGEGGYVIVAPSAGTVHPTGLPWKRIAGGPDTVPTITPDEREALHALFGTLHEPLPDQPAQEELVPREARPDDGRLTPGDDFENKTGWDEILTGWTYLFTAGATSYWRRPGKNLGISATTGHAEDRDRLWVFTSSTEFQQETPYTKFGAYALLHHQGNHSAAASALRKEGFGDPLPLERPITLNPFTPTPAAPQTTGNLALNDDGPLATVHQLASITVTSSTDYGNAQLLVNRHDRRLRYTPQGGSWIRWDNSRWYKTPDPGPAIEAAWETIQSINTDKDKDLAMHKHRSLSRRSIEAAVALAKADPRMRVDADDLDAWPHELNTPTGIVDLRTGGLGPHDPAKFHTKITRANYNPDATAPHWEAFLEATFNGDQEMIAYLQRLAGYATTGEVTEHILPFLHGSGGNGKSVFLEVLSTVLGDYATTAPAGFLMAGREQHETEVARLHGARLVVCSEINLGAKFDEAKVKLLTGGDKLTARFMHRDHFTFTPSHTLFIMGNHQPRVSAGGEGFWRRLRLLPFTHTVPEDKKIPGLAKFLIEAEGPGILNWLVAGAVDVLENGLRDPAPVRAATHEYAEEEDALARFIEDKCTLGPDTGFRVDTSVMRREYDIWCREQGEQPLSPQQFGRDLKNRHNVSQQRSHGKRYYTGITIFKNDPDGPEHWTNR